MNDSKGVVWLLARNAESLYWIGRYVERADDTARILDVSVHELLEDASVDPDLASRQLLNVLGIQPPEDTPLDVWSLTELVAYEAGRSGSIVDSLTSARENTRGAREVVPTELWQCLNATWRALPERQAHARRVGPHEFLSYVEERAAMFAGLADSTMCRDDGWRFLVLGRSIERADMVLRLLLSRVRDRASSPGWMTVLRSAGAQDTIPRRFCTGTVTTSDGVRRELSYVVAEDTGIIGWGWGVRWCVVGLDRELAYAPACKMARP